MSASLSPADLLVVGESVADVILQPDGGSETHAGGSPANVAYGLARLGADVALLTQLGADDDGALIAAHLVGAGVRLVAAPDPELRTPRATARIQPDGSARYDFEIGWTLAPRETPAEQGRIHPISQVMDELTASFADMGFSIAEGPDIETDDYNFTKLNFPEGHPAREMHDTFFLEPGPDGSRKVLRTHTSPVQIRSMKKSNEKPAAPYLTPAMDPPLRIIAPGRTYRHDSDQTHTPMFHQVEGLVIDKSSHIGQLRWVLEEFLKAFFEVPNVTLRFRPSFFPFTEPSMEVDVGCDRSGAEVKIGEGNDWLEILGCGMVHPNVLRNCGLDPDVYQGFAWGMGIDRLAMLKYGMNDLRAFFDADKRWLDHYGFRAFDMPTLFGGLSS